MAFRCLAQVFLLGLCCPAQAQREEVPFSRAWRFHYGPGGDDATYGPGNSWQAAFSPISGCAADPVRTYPDPHRMTFSDCQTACAYDPLCLAWVHNATGRALCTHATAGAVCTPAASNATTVGGQRAAATPLQTAYEFAAASLPQAAAWPLVDAPHDALASLNGSFCEACGDARHAYRQRTVAWYRKAFALPAEWAAGGGATFLRFEGIMHFAQLWLNGVYLGSHASTYGEFVVRLDNVSGVVFGGPNVLAIRADGSYGSEHWYGGAGLFREVQLVHTGAVAFVEQGVWLPPELALGATSTAAVGEWENHGSAAAAAAAAFHLALYDAQGTCVANATSAPTLAQPGEVVLARVTLLLPASLPRWSGASPVLYTAVARLVGAGGGVLDSRNVSVGFRATAWDAERGFLLDGRPLRQRGFSHHNSFAGVGVAMPPRLDLFRAQVSRALGANIWRMSHNPYRTALYDILDALGTLVWDENRDLGPAYLHQMHDMVKRGRNHVSIAVNSLCNEIECDSVMDAGGVNVVGAAMVNLSRAMDPTRPTTANSDSADGLGSIIDVQGFSHASAAAFTAAHAAKPQQPLVLSECCSCSTQRAPRSYDYSCMQEQNAPGDLPFVAGSLGVWTLFDYFGEPPGLWPFVSSSFGQMDLAGFPKGHAYWYTANWLDARGQGSGTTAAQPTCRVLDVLDAPLGTPGGISAVTSAATAELLADGASLGVQPAQGALLFWALPAAAAGAAAGLNCSWPVSQDGRQCKGLTQLTGLASPAECQAHACDKGHLAWQWGSSSSSAPGHPPACWVGTPASDPAAPCPPPPSPKAQWQGASRSGAVRLPANATLIARDAGGAVVGVHTVLAPAGGPAALRLTLDAPSPATATGQRLVLDGADIALVRVSVVDSAGVVVTAAPVNVSFSVVSGPGRLAGVGAGDPAAHEQPNGAAVASFGGVARALVAASVDCVSVGRDRARAVDVEGALGPTTVLPEGAACPGEDVVVAADSAGLPRALLRIPTSGNVAVDGVLAVARASVGGSAASEYLREFEG